MPEARRKIVGRDAGLKRRLFLVVVFSFLITAAGFLALLIKLPSEVMARGVFAGPFALGGLTRGEALKLLAGQANIFEGKGIDFINGGRAINLPSVISSLTDQELSYVIFDFHSEDTVAAAFQMGRQGNFWRQFQERLFLRFVGRRLPVRYSLDEERAEQFLKVNFSAFEKQPREISLDLRFQEGRPQVDVVAGEIGQVFNYQLMLAALRERLERLEAFPVSAVSQIIYPRLTLAEAETMKKEAEKLLSEKNDLLLTYEGKDYAAPASQWFSWLKMSKSEKRAFLDLDEEKMGEDIKILIPQVERAAQEAKFALADGRAVEFSPGWSGFRLKIEKTKENIRQVLFAGAAKAEVAAEKIDPLKRVANLNDMGIKEIIGVGRSNFRGSPPNRIHNIKVGAASLNGLLIAPGEIFSLLKALGEIDAKAGYKPELVIKGNKTVPEFGGGLCQIGTTTFRVALDAGLPILERQNHSYRVPYYEPPVGVDATIYFPKPDFKFLNDTAHYILIQTKVEGYELIFEFWGAKDGRKVEMTEPKVFNRVPPPPAKLIETLDLPPGKKKCTEKPHAGADAVFTYTVAYADGTVKTQEFKSHYRPWGEVCLIGVEQLSEPSGTNGETTTSTPSAAPQ